MITLGLMTKVCRFKVPYWNRSHPAPPVLTWVSIYWFARAGPAASVRIYYEYVKRGIPDPRTTAPVHVPTGHSYFPKELAIVPRLYVPLASHVKTLTDRLI